MNDNFFSKRLTRFDSDTLAKLQAEYRKTDDSLMPNFDKLVKFWSQFSVAEEPYIQEAAEIKDKCLRLRHKVRNGEMLSDECDEKTNKMLKWHNLRYKRFIEEQYVILSEMTNNKHLTIGDVKRFLERNPHLWP